MQKVDADISRAQYLKQEPRFKRFHPNLKENQRTVKKC